jgi:putative PIN family toxin of toxin-antitoxin system
VLRRPKFAYLVPDLNLVMDEVKAMSVVVEPELRLDLLSDEPDNRVLEAALAGHADYVVTGDKHFFELHSFDAKIMTPINFLTLLRSGIL